MQIIQIYEANLQSRLPGGSISRLGNSPLVSQLKNRARPAGQRPLAPRVMFPLARKPLIQY